MAVDKHDEILRCVTETKVVVDSLKQDMNRRMESVENTVFGKDGEEGLKGTVGKLKSESGVAKHYLSMAIGAIIVAAVGTWFAGIRPAIGDQNTPGDQATEARRSENE